MAFSSLRQGGLHWIRRVLQSGAGVLVGYSPMILMALLVPGFFESVTDRLTILLERGATNVSLPIPWPWTVWTSPPPYIKTLGLDPLAGYIVGFFYLIWFVFLAAVGLFMLRDREPLTQARAVLVAATLVSLPYLHHASARAGITHLAQSIHPLLIGLIAAAYLIPRIRFSQAVPVTVIALMLMSAASIVTLSPAYKRYSSRSNIFKLALVGKDEIVLRKDIAREVRVAERIGKVMVAPDESVFIAPRLPAYYPIMRRKSPIKETYLTVKESVTRQEAMLEELEASNTQWAIIGDKALDDRDALRFRNTHPLVWKHIAENFERIEVKGIRKHHTLFKRRE
jgi:hypothetical protein